LDHANACSDQEADDPDHLPAPAHRPQPRPEAAQHGLGLPSGDPDSPAEIVSRRHACLLLAVTSAGGSHG
jgi:hypothetical protein